MHLKLLITLCCLLLTGCERAPEAQRQMDNYLERLGRVLDHSWTAYDLRQLSDYRMPERRERMLDIPELRLGMLDLVVESRRCQTLQQRVGERNSSLGKVMPWSHRFAHDGALLTAIDQCLAVIADDPSREDLRKQLQEIAKGKRQALPATFWNALNATPEFEYYLRFADRPLPVSELPLQDRDAVAAMQRLANIGAGLPEQLPPDREELESLFQALQRSTRGSQLVNSLAQLTHTLDQATAMLDGPAAAKLCPLQRPTPRARILQNVFVTFYAGEIQPYIAQVQRLGQPWQQALQQLSAVQQIPPSTETYLGALGTEQDSLWQRYQNSLDAHSKAWQNVLGTCQLQPGQPGWDKLANGA